MFPSCLETKYLMQNFIIYTMFDITKTDVLFVDYSAATDELRKQRNQHRNWQMFFQAIQLRSQPMNLSCPIRAINSDVFGNRRVVWYFKFSYESDGIFQFNDDQTYFLKKDLENIPLTIGLDECPFLETRNIIPFGDDINTIVMVDNHGEMT